MDELVRMIIAGKESGESASDVLALCFLSTLVVSSVEEVGPEGVEPDQLPPNDERDFRFRSRLKRLGKILCPIADDVKHDRTEYVEQMVQVRLDYSGIAMIGRLQSEFQGKIFELAVEGQLRSLEHAIESEVYRSLRRQQDLRFR